MASNSNLSLPKDPPEIKYTPFKTWCYQVWQLIRNFDLVGTSQGTTQLDGNLVVTGTISSQGSTVTGNEHITGNLQVDGNENINGTLGVGGLATLTGGATIPLGANLTGMPLSILAAAAGMDDCGSFGVFPAYPIIPSKVVALNTSGQSIATGTATTVTGWTSTFSTGGFVASTGIFTAPAPGYYLVSASVFYTNAAWAAGNVITGTIVHGATTVAIGYHNIEAALANNFVSTITVSAIIQCAAGDTISIQTSQNSGAARTLYTGAGYTYLNITQVQ